MDNGKFSIIPMSQVPTGVAILPAVWQMKLKQDIKKKDTKKWKVRLNIDLSGMEKIIQYE